MDAAELKVVCDNYERRIDGLEAALNTANEGLNWQIGKAICARHGGHEFIDKGPYGATYKECKYCLCRPED